MTSLVTRSRRGSTWIALAALAALAVGVGVWFLQWRGPRDHPFPGARVGEPSDSSIEQALRQIPAPVDSAALKSRWTEVVRGVDLAGLSRARRELFIRLANAERCTCG